MDIVTLVNRDIVAAATATAERTTSPYFGHADLDRRLRPLHDRLEQLSERRPEVLTGLAEHLDVPPTLDDVLAEVDQTARKLLDALQTPQNLSQDQSLIYYQSDSCSP